ncbi:MAG: 3'-5' exonuclease [Cyclobacteriaceae bacterium]|nr:3'-5' exonuclease [Cyclobacteriaceae bacterium]
MSTFVSIDFETATGKRNSACAVGVVCVEAGAVVDEFYTLIQPPNNEYNWFTTNIHGITARDTVNSPTFPKIYQELKKRIANNTIVAHNAPFDRSVLMRTMEYYALDYGELNLENQWECTLKIYRGKGYHPATLDACCKRNGIQLRHHEALSDAQACAKLYLLR